MVTAGSLYNNLKGWSYDTSGKISFDKAEGEVLKEALERFLPKPVELRTEGDVNDWHWRIYTCPSYRHEIAKVEAFGNKAACPADYCESCGQHLIRAKEEA